MTNLLERAETRKETFYKLTNSGDVPTAPSVGGRNLLTQTNQGKTNWWWSASSGGTTAEDYNADGVNAVKLTRTIDSQASWSYIQYQGLIRNLIEPNTNYVLSFDVNPSIDVTLAATLVRGDALFPLTNSVTMNKATANQWTKVSCVLTSKTTLPDNWGQVVYLQGMPTAKDNYLIIKNIKLERGENYTPHSPAPEDLGWSSTTLVPTQANRYLWKFEYIYYSDGSVEVTQPTNISIAGADGTNGQTSHVHFAFADNATGGGFSLTTPKAYMGWYADFNEAASNDPTKYKWSKWKGDEGVPGKPGADGKTSYFHMAYADSANGKTGFSFKESGQQYQGYYTDFTQTSSTDPNKYTWMDRRAGVETGMVNLFKGSRDFSGTDWVNKNSGIYAEDYQGVKIFKKQTLWGGVSQYFEVKAGEEYVFSAYVKSSAKTDGVLFYLNHDSKQPKAQGSVSFGSVSNQEHIYFELTDEYQRIVIKIKIISDGWIMPRLERSNTNAYLFFGGYKLERGNIATDWSPALEDTQEQIDSKADQVLTQEQLNALAEKNRNMEAELAAKASLETIEQWKQAYDAYVAQNDRDKSNQEQNLVTLSTRLAEWVKDWEDKKVQWSFLDTNMDFGEEGLRLGKKGSPTSIMISNDRISFFSGGSEVASMSNGTLTIDNGIFAKSLQIGHYREEVYEGDKNINVIRWVD